MAYELPDIVKPYAHLIVNTGGNDIEELIDDFLTNDFMIRSNLPRYLLAVSVNSQISLLVRMISQGLLDGSTASQA